MDLITQGSNLMMFYLLNLVSSADASPGSDHSHGPELGGMQFLGIGIIVVITVVAFYFLSKKKK